MQATVCLCCHPVQDAEDAEQGHQQAGGQGEDASGREWVGRFLGWHPKMGSWQGCVQ
jgi:hypothetical protein